MFLFLFKMAASGSHVQVKLFTKQSQYSVPDTPFSVPDSAGPKELCSLINGLLKESATFLSSLIDFDFLINGEFLNVSLKSRIQAKNIPAETVIEIEYLEQHPAPQPEDSLIHNDWISCLEGNLQFILSGCYDNTVHLWTTKGESLTIIPGHSAPVKCVSWINLTEDDPVSEFISGSHDQTLLLWKWHRDTNEVDCVCVCRGHAASVDCVSVEKTGRKICSGSWDSLLKLWSTDADANCDVPESEQRPSKKKKTAAPKIQSRVPLLTLSGHTEGISSVSWLDQTTVCSASWDHTIKLWDMEKAEVKSSIQGSKVFLDLSYSPHNHLIVTGSADRHVRLWDHRTSEGAIVKSSFTSHRGWVSGVSWSPNNSNHFISGSYDMLMKLWDMRSPKAPLYNMTGHEDKILAVDWSIPDLLLSGGADNHLKIFQQKELSG